jgi:hypothetical protein
LIILIMLGEEYKLWRKNCHYGGINLLHLAPELKYGDVFHLLKMVHMKRIGLYQRSLLHVY